MTRTQDRGIVCTGMVKPDGWQDEDGNWQVLGYVLLNCNPYDRNNAFTRKTGRLFDLRDDRPYEDCWSVTCNLGKIGDGSRGFIVRYNGGPQAQIAGLVKFYGAPVATQEVHDIVHYGPGVIWKLPEAWWIDGAAIGATQGWPVTRSPFGRSTSQRQFRGGESLTVPMIDALQSLLHPVAREWFERG